MTIEQEKVSTEVRNGYIEEVEQIVPFDDQEKKDQQYVTNWLVTTEFLNKPYNMIEHLGVLCILLSPDRQKTYLLHHKKAQTLLPPGGHVDLNLSFSEAANAEFEEELQSPAKLIVQHPFFITRTSTRGLNAGHTDITSWFILNGNPDEQYHIHEKEALKAEWIEIMDLLKAGELGHLHRAYLKLVQMLKNDGRLIS